MPIRSLWFLFTIAAVALLPAPARGQSGAGAGVDLARPPCAVLPAPLSPSGPRADYLRVAEVAGVVPVDMAGLVRPSSRASSSRCAHPDSTLWPGIAAEPAPEGARAAPGRVRVVRNSAYPRDRNNGALWAGRGAAAGVQAGVLYRRGAVRASLAPVVTWSENLGIRVTTVVDEGFHPLAHPWHTRGIDWPQRPGDDQVLTLSPGDSYVRYDGDALTVGVSTESLWLGPARRNPVLMSNTAAGFPHLFVGSGPPVETVIGQFDVQLAAGLLSESGYWDDDPDNDRRLITLFALTYRPRWVPGLTVGTGRTYREILRPGRLPLDRVLLNLIDLPLLDVASDARGSEISSVFARWVFPDAGFEAYGEWAREEDPESVADFLMEPDYTQGYVLGAQQVIRGWPGWWRVWAELTHLAPSSPVMRGRPDAPYYTDIQGGQGHTHGGQLLGAWIGPGSETQGLGVDLFHRFGGFGIYGERVRFDDAAYYRAWARMYGEARHDAEVTAGFRGSVVAGSFEAVFEMAWSLRYDRQFVALGPPNPEPFDEDNRMTELYVIWRP